MRLFVIAFSIIIVLGSCRKDLLHVQSVQKLDTHTTEDRFNNILFINDTLGFVVGGQRFLNSTILTTRDGGNTWAYNSYPDAGKGIYGITQAPSGSVYAIAFDGKLLSSATDGHNWELHQIAYLPFKDLAFVNNNKGIVIGGVSFRLGYMAIIDSAGNSEPYQSFDYELNDIEMIDGSTGYITGHGIVLKTIDSGITWQTLNIKNDNFTAISTLGPFEAWTCGYNGSVFHTKDGGNNWKKLRDGNDITQPGYKLLDILFTDPLNGYAVGEDGLFIYTDDGGHHWMEFDRFTSSALRSIVARSDKNFLTAGDNGSLYHITVP